MDRNKKQEIINALNTISEICTDNSGCCQTCPLFDDLGEPIGNCVLFLYHPSKYGDLIEEELKDK